MTPVGVIVGVGGDKQRTLDLRVDLLLDHRQDRLAAHGKGRGSVRVCALGLHHFRRSCSSGGSSGDCCALETRGDLDLCAHTRGGSKRQSRARGTATTNAVQGAARRRARPSGILQWMKGGGVQTGQVRGKWDSSTSSLVW